MGLGFPNLIQVTPSRGVYMNIRIFVLVTFFSAGFYAQQATAVEVISARELGILCNEFPNDTTGSRKCQHYVQGLVDGAVATDVRVMLNIEAERSAENLTERALRTRARVSDVRRAAGYAEFCLGDPVPLSDVVSKVADELRQIVEPDSENTPARDVVYQSLRRHYPCKS